MDIKPQTLDFLSKTVCFLYREIGVLESRNHPQVASKALLKSNFFRGERKKIAKELYHKTKAEEDTGRILEPYQYKTGLTLEDLYTVFANGHWRNGSGGYSFGGPKWADIARTAIELRQIIDAAEWEKAIVLLAHAKRLQHNNGCLINKFNDLD